MTVHGGYGVMLQLSEASIQEAINAFYLANIDKFRISTNITIPVLDKAVAVKCTINVNVGVPIICLSSPRTFVFSIPLSSTVETTANILDIDGNQTAPPPPINIKLLGNIVAEIDGDFVSHTQKRYLSVSLKNLTVSNFNIEIGNSNVDFGDQTLKVLSTFVRRLALLALTNNVEDIPVSMTLGKDIAAANINEISFDYKNVKTSDHRALAILLQVNHELVNYNKVSYALEGSGNAAIYIDLNLLNLALNAAERWLEGKRISDLDEDHPNNDLYKNLELSDVRLRADQGHFVVENIEVAIRIIKRIVRTIKKVLCTAIDPCDWYCEDVFETIVEDIVQFDQVANVHGTLVPYILDGKITAHSNLDADLANWVKALILAAGTLIPNLVTFTSILVILSPIFLSKIVNDAVSKWEKEKIIDQEIPSANMKVIGKMKKIVWQPDTMGIIVQTEFIPN